MFQRRPCAILYTGAGAVEGKIQSGVLKSKLEPLETKQAHETRGRQLQAEACPVVLGVCCVLIWLS